MRTTFSIVLVLSIVFSITMVQAIQAEDTCTVGTNVSVRGEIDNNAVNLEYPNELGQYTMGIADIKIGDDKQMVKMNCALLGEPTGEENPYVGHQYDHMIVCNDGQQSEIAFKTTIVAQDSYLPNVLTSDEIEDFCHNPGAVLGFEEKAEVNEDRFSKGLFQGASGNLRIVGCVNLVDSVVEINMGVEGALCLPNWQPSVN